MIRKIFESEKCKERIYIGLLIFLSIIVFFLLGNKGYVLLDDSYGYIDSFQKEGVMPLYPLFLFFNRALFGDNTYLQWVVCEQGVIAAVCIISFEEKIRRRFGFGHIYGILAYAALIFPFTIEMPTAMITHIILTEGLTYALFYVFMSNLLSFVWEKKCRFFIGSCFWAFVLSMIRSQLQILYVFCAMALAYYILLKKGVNILLRIAFSGILCLLVCLAGIKLNVLVVGRYTELLNTVNSFTKYAATINRNIVLEFDKESSEEEKTSENEGDDSDSNFRFNAVSSQYATVLFSRGMYEADREDYLLFEDENLQKLFLFFYEKENEDKVLYNYAQPGLWMWRDISGGIGRLGVDCFFLHQTYYENNLNEMGEDIWKNYSSILNSNYINIGITLIKEHWPRVLLHWMAMLPQAFISTVFFQYAPLYLTCHVITFILYFTAILLTVWGFKNRQVNNGYAEFMATVIVLNVAMVTIISIIFFCQQRYVIYTFGLFYVAYGLLITQWWKTCGKNLLEKKRK